MRVITHCAPPPCTLWERFDSFGSIEQQNAWCWVNEVTMRMVMMLWLNKKIVQVSVFFLALIFCVLMKRQFEEQQQKEIKQCQERSLQQQEVQLKFLFNERQDKKPKELRDPGTTTTTTKTAAKMDNLEQSLDPHGTSLELSPSGLKDSPDQLMIEVDEEDEKYPATSDLSTELVASRILNVLLLSSNPRSGSSYLADILTPENTKSAYFFEPLRWWDNCWGAASLEKKIVVSLSSLSSPPPPHHAGCSTFPLGTMNFGWNGVEQES